MFSLPEIVIQAKIYESSASLVYRGIRVHDDQSIIVKALKQGYPTTTELTRYKQEYEITRSLNLEGVIKAYSQQDYQRSLVIILEDFGGASLEQWMQNRPEIYRPMSLSAFLHLAISITEILGSIHAANVIHKDINPGNLVLDPDTGVVKIIDFGISTRFSRTNPILKSPHVLEGTLAYLSPEQTGRMNRLLDHRTDFYSLGATFYELLTGQLPFTTSDVLELVHCHLAQQPTPPCEVRTAVPSVVSDIILKLMAKNAEDRYQSAWGIKTDLEACLRQLELTDQIEDFPLAINDISDKFQISQQLYGREKEVETLLKVFDRVASRDVLKGKQRNTELMLVAGYSGIGKSALVQQIYKPITEKRGYFIAGKFEQLQRNIPYAAIASALAELMQQLLTEPEARLHDWREKLMAALGTNGQLMINIIPEIELIIGQQPPVQEIGAAESQNRFNLVFQKFIQTFCSDRRPLVIFLDDVQWIDSATLKLIELIMTDRETESLFLIGAYRDNEVHPTHPLMMTLEYLRKRGAAIDQITLEPLGLEAIASLIADTLQSDLASVHSLTDLVIQKTGGNPFFVNEFLKTLYAENLVIFDLEQCRWRWDIAQIESQSITDNVVELMIHKLRQLPESSQEVLRLAACVGADFDLSTLSIISEQSPTDIFGELTRAISAGLVLATSELDEHLLIQKYKFSHDQVQQAAYTLIEESQKPDVHLKIGRNLLQTTASELSLDSLFKTVDHFNLGIMLVTEQSERNQIARLNLIAGQKAKAAMAYEAAKQYLIRAIELLAVNSWHLYYTFTLSLYEEAVETAYLCGDFVEMEDWIAVVLQQAKDILDKVKVYEVKILTCVAQGKLLAAVEIGLQVLEMLGITLPKLPTSFDIQQQLERTKAAWNGKNIADLINLPLMTDTHELAAIYILSTITAAAYVAAPSLLPIIVCEQANLSIAHGNMSFSAYTYAAYGLILNGIVEDSESAYQFGQLALNLVERLNAKAIKCKTFHVVAVASIHGTKHLKETLPLYQEAYASGTENGDLEYASYAAYSKCQYAYSSGVELIELEKEMTNFSDAIAQLKQETTFNWHQIFRQTVLNLLGHGENPWCLKGEAYDEEKLLPLHVTANDRTGLHFFYANKSILCYLFEEFTQALDYTIAAEPYLDGVTGLANAPQFYFYDSLVRLMVYSSVSQAEQEYFLSKVTSNQEKMRKWANQAPMNFQHKYELVEAERFRVSGQVLEAEEFYEKAMQGASENGYVQEEALAYELTAKFYLSRGRGKIAQTYLKEACYCYERWGAKAKVADLSVKYPHLLFQSATVRQAVNAHIESFRPTISSNSPKESLDLETMMKASQAISGEIVLDKLLASLMKILIENTGAQKGFLLLETAGNWKIEAACEIDCDIDENACSIKVLQSFPLEGHIPTAIINYTIHSGDSVVLTDAARKGKFTLDPYIREHQPKSILCAPLLNQGQLNGIVYLENNLTTGAFTSDRIKVLQFLSGQAAITIANAKLYAEIKEKESRLTQFIDAMPIGVTVHSSTGQITYANRAAHQLTDRSDLLTEATPEQITEIHQVYKAGTNQIYPTDQLPIVRSLAGETVTVEDIEVRRSDKTAVIQISSTPVFDETGKIAYAITACQDITERKQAEKLLADYNRTLEQQVVERTAALQKSEAALRDVYEELRLREQELRLITNALPALISYVDANQRYQFVNQAYEVWFRCSRDEILGKSVRELLDETAYHIAEPNINRAQDGQIATYETEISYPSGKKYISATFIPDFDSNAQVKGYYGLVTDISEQRNAALRERKRAEEASILEERNRMAREIHDTLAQSFTGILIQVSAATQVLTDDLEATQAHLEMIDELARTGLAEARRSVTALRPQLLEDGSLDNALYRLVTQMRAASDTDLIYEIKGTVYPLPAEVENNLLRIGQEALTNALKYADAGEIRVELVYENAQCILRIKDDGRGFGVASLPSVGGFGLLGMSERAEHIGAQLTIKSQPKQGTEIIVIVNQL
jgi:PAS domain S-box-containing protein